jgi:hypothetical protein
MRGRFLPKSFNWVLTFFSILLGAARCTPGAKNFYEGKVISITLGQPLAAATTSLPGISRAILSVTYLARRV